MPPALPTTFERSARKGLLAWASLLIGAVFIYAAYTVDPQKNCDETGRECAPWLVPIAGIMGWCITAMALGQLWANPRRGYAIDPESGELVWWKNRTSRSEGDMGRIHPTQIVSIRINRLQEDESISLIGEDGERFAYFDEELVPWPYDRWAEQFQSAYPHIRIDKQD
jgi:hypothetical protein